MKRVHQRQRDTASCRQRLLIAAAALTLQSLLLPILSADVIHLKDGRKLEGEITKTDAGWVVRDASGKITKVTSDRVKSIEAKRETGPDDATQRLASLRRSTANLEDIQKILDRYNAFIQQHKGTPAADEAQRDAGEWEQRLREGREKFGERWVTPEERDSIRALSLVTAGDARRLMLQGRLRDAEPLIDQALTENPESAAALYLRGVILFRQGMYPASRKAFEAVAALVPNHAPTLNNLAVMLWQKEQIGGALNFYDRAMAASPENRQILDNVAEALNVLPKQDRDDAATLKVVRRFNEQDDALQATMAKKGLFRWGSSWVDRAELDRLEAKEREIKDELEAMESEFEGVQDAIAEIDDEMEETRRSIRRIEATNYGRDSSGKPFRRVYPRIYYELLDDLRGLEQQREREAAKLDRLRKEAKRVQQKLPTPRYREAQRLIDVDGAPELDPIDPPPEPPAAAAPNPREGDRDDAGEDDNDRRRDAAEGGGVDGSGDDEDGMDRRRPEDERADEDSVPRPRERAEADE